MPALALHALGMLLLLLDTALLLVLLARDAHLRRGRTQRGDAIRRERRARIGVLDTARSTQRAISVVCVGVALRRCGLGWGGMG
jgi:hypothetical protein